MPARRRYPVHRLHAAQLGSADVHARSRFFDTPGAMRYNHRSPEGGSTKGSAKATTADRGLMRWSLPGLSASHHDGASRRNSLCERDTHVSIFTPGIPCQPDRCRGRLVRSPLGVGRPDGREAPQRHRCRAPGQERPEHHRAGHRPRARAAATSSVRWASPA